jgi:hypothetical protein
MTLKLLSKGVWIDPAVIESIVAFEAHEEFGRKIGPRVIVHCRGTAPIWEFDTYDEASAFAGSLAASLISP